MAQNTVVRALRMCFLSGMLAVMVLLILPLTVSAHTIPNSHASSSSASSVTIKIVQKHGNYNFKPKVES